jgi:flagellar basal body rod protein FlgG
MSHARFSFFCSSGFGLVAGAAGQLLVAAAAVAGVICVAGCQNAQQAQWIQQQQLAQQRQQAELVQQQQQAAAMRSLNAASPQGTMIEQPPQTFPPQQNPPAQLNKQTRPRITDPVASQAERKKSQRPAIDAAVGDALAPAQQPATASRGTAALRVADAAIKPLADTLTAIESAQRVVVDNLRNAETPGFKASRTACGDSRDVTKQLDVTQGELQATQRSFDIAIQGEGFLQVQVYVASQNSKEQSEPIVGFTRNGRLYVSKDCHLVVGEEGYQIVPPIQVPVGTTEIRVEANGMIRVAQPGSDKPGLQPLQRLVIARYTDPSALQPLSAGIYAETSASGSAVESSAGERGAGTISQGYLDASNVDLIKERMRLRFLQNWRATILAAMDGEVNTSATPQAEAAVPAAAPTPTQQPPATQVQISEPLQPKTMIRLSPQRPAAE